MENPKVYAGLNMLSDDELKKLRQAIDNELSERYKKLEQATSLADNLVALLQRVLEDGFDVVIETETDEIAIDSKQSEEFSVAVYPAT